MSSDAATLSAQVNKLAIKDTNNNTAEANDSAPAELVAAVDDLLNQLHVKFNTASGEILKKMDEMSRRIDRLEASLQADSRRMEGEDEG